MQTSHLILVAGGVGARMASNTPKQFLDLCGQPVIVHTIKRFIEAMPDIRITVVLPPLHFNQWEGIKETYFGEQEIKAAEGGDTRFHSVQNGLATILANDEDIIGIHDAVRPFVSTEVIRNCYRAAQEHGAAIPLTPLKESIRKLDEEGQSRAVARDNYRVVQTPQCFSLDLLNRAYQQPYNPKITDDATLVEQTGKRIHHVEGNVENLKITSAIDWEMAKVFLSQTYGGG